jgi:hypothetical protein
MRILLLLITLWAMSVKAQMWVNAKEGFKIRFFSSTPLEDIDAVSKNGKMVVQSSQNLIQIKLQIKDFHFKNALMEEHFNENYMETERFPNSSFSGTLTGISSYSTDGKYNVTAKGWLEIHGVKNLIQIPGSITIQNQKLILHSVFTVKLVDYKIKVPSLYITNIAEQIEITFDASLEPYVK